LVLISLDAFGVGKLAMAPGVGGCSVRQVEGDRDERTVVALGGDAMGRSTGVAMQALLGSLTEKEQALVYETGREQLADLAEDDLVELHTRVRRMRDKYVSVYRRSSAARVGDQGARGYAYPKGTRDRAKAEVFEDALARVSRRLAAAARASAQALRAERLAEARAMRNAEVPATEKPAPPLPGSQQLDRRPRTPDRVKRHATTRAATQRVQGRRDSR
jgi:hypothetical protein